jgi:PAS domain S-box-containing protein
MTVERRVRITTGVLVLSIIGTSLMIFWSSRMVADGIKQSTAMTRIVRSTFLLRNLMDEILVRGDKRPLQQWNKYHEDIDQLLNTKGAFDLADPKLVEDLRNTFQKVSSLAEQAVQLSTSVKSEEQRRNLETKMKVITGLLYRRLEELAKAADDLNMALLTATMHKRSVLQAIIVTTGLLMGIIIWVNIYLIRKSVVYPLKALSAGADGIGAGNYDFVPEIKSDDEVGRLALAFNSMITRLRDHAFTTKESEERLKHALEVGQLGSWGLNIKTGSAWRTLRHDRIFGYQEMLSEWTYQMFLDHILQEDVKGVDDKFNEALRTHTEWNFECRIRRVDGVERWIWAQGLPRFDDQGILTEMVGLVQDITDRKKTENELRESEKRYRRLHESISDAIVHTDMSGRLIEFNKAYEHMLGYSREELLKLTYVDLTPSKWHQLESSIVSGEILPFGRSRVYEKEYICKSAKILPVELRTFLIEDDMGSPSGMLAIVRDVTERKNAQEALQRAHDELELRVRERTAELAKASEAIATERRRLYDILETMPVMVCLLTPDYRVAFANRSFRDRFGEDNGRHCYDYCFGQKEPCEFCESYKVLKTGKPHYWEVKSPDGSVIAAYDFPFTDTDGSPLILEMDIDITEQRRAQEVVRVERQRLYDVLETLPVYVCLLDSDYRMPFANRYFRETFGESQGRRCHDYLFDRTEPCETCETYTAMKTRAPHHWCWTGPNGRDYDVYDFPFIDTDGSRVILEMGIDITEAKSAQREREKLIAELEAKNFELERFTYTVSHDLKSPLITINTFLGFVSEDVETGNKENLQADMERIYRATEKMGKLLSEILELSRIGRMGNPPSDAPMADVVNDALEIMSGRLVDNGVEISLAPGLPILHGDCPRLQEVFQNLIENSLKFMGVQPHPRIEIGARVDGEETVLFVKDNGIGIDPLFHEKVFGLFDKLNPKTEGTGIGLALVKRIVEVHSGRIWVESDGIGHGSTFCFTLPYPDLHE